VSLALDASAAIALHFSDEREPFIDLENKLAEGEEAFTAPNFFQEVMEALRRALREKRTTHEDVQAWLSVLELPHRPDKSQSRGGLRNLADRRDAKYFRLRRRIHRCRQSQRRASLDPRSCSDEQSGPHRRQSDAVSN